MMPASAAIRRTVPALTGDGDPVDLAVPTPVRSSFSPIRTSTVTGGNPSIAVRSQPAACRNTSTAASERSWARLRVSRSSSASPAELVLSRNRTWRRSAVTTASTADTT